MLTIKRTDDTSDTWVLFGDGRATPVSAPRATWRAYADAKDLEFRGDGLVARYVKSSATGGDRVVFASPPPDAPHDSILASVVVDACYIARFVDEIDRVLDADEAHDRELTAIADHGSAEGIPKPPADPSRNLTPDEIARAARVMPEPHATFLRGVHVRRA